MVIALAKKDASKGVVKKHHIHKKLPQFYRNSLDNLNCYKKADVIPAALLTNNMLKGYYINEDGRLSSTKVGGGAGGRKGKMAKHGAGSQPGSGNDGSANDGGSVNDDFGAGQLAAARQSVKGMTTRPRRN